MINLCPKLGMHVGGTLVLFVDLCLRCVNFSSFLPDTTVAMLAAWAKAVSGKKRVNVSFVFAHVMAYEVLGPCHCRQALQRGVHCWTNGCTPFSNHIWIFRLGIILAGH